MDAPIRWGILGCGRIARRFYASLNGSEHGLAYAVAGRDSDKAEAFAHECPVAVVYDSLGALLEDPNVEAVYIALPHALHADWSIKALRAGKAVLCEKPAVLTAQELHGVIACAHSTKRLYMEAMKTRFVPLHARLMKLLDEGDLGRIQFVEASQCCLFPDDITGYFIDPVQGGCLYDEGIYCVSWLDELLPGKVQIDRTNALFLRGVDWYDNVQLSIGSVPVQLEVAADRGPKSTLHIECEWGSVDVPTLHRPQTATIHRFGQPDQTLSAPYVRDDFAGQIEHFQNLLLAGKHESPIMPLAASLRCAEIIDAIRASWQR